MTNLVTLHGGCFVGGSASWDHQQTQMFEKMGFIVHQLEFPKDNLKQTVDFILNYLSKFDDQPFYLLGRSSGGFLAKYIFDHYRSKLLGLKSVIYLAPVFNPKLRGTLNPTFKDKQDYYFRFASESDMLTCNFNQNKELLILATHDENVPMECFTKKQLDHAVYLGIKTHKGLTCTTSKAFQLVISKALKL